MVGGGVGGQGCCRYKDLGSVHLLLPDGRESAASSAPTNARELINLRCLTTYRTWSICSRMIGSLISLSRDRSRTFDSTSVVFGSSLAKGRNIRPLCCECTGTSTELRIACSGCTCHKLHLKPDGEESDGDASRARGNRSGRRECKQADVQILSVLCIMGTGCAKKEEGVSANSLPLQLFACVRCRSCAHTVHGHPRSNAVFPCDSAI